MNLKDPASEVAIGEFFSQWLEEGHRRTAFVLTRPTSNGTECLGLSKFKKEFDLHTISRLETWRDDFRNRVKLVVLFPIVLVNQAPERSMRHLTLLEW